jgi:hypothetical protein
VPLSLRGKSLFAAKLRKNFSFVICKELKFFFYECLNLTTFQTDALLDYELFGSEI